MKCPVRLNIFLIFKWWWNDKWFFWNLGFFFQLFVKRKRCRYWKIELKLWPFWQLRNKYFLKKSSGVSGTLRKLITKVKMKNRYRAGIRTKVFFRKEHLCGKNVLFEYDNKLNNCFFKHCVVVRCKFNSEALIKS